MAAVSGQTDGLPRQSRDMLVVHLPNANDRYQRLLIAALNSAGVTSAFDAPLTRSATMNVLLAPLSLAFARWRGTRIIHVHYLFAYSLRWATSRVSRRVLRWWFGLWLLSLRLLGLRLVWTAHNILPHEPIFDDDQAARRMLIRRADAVIALSEYGRRAIKQKFGADVAAVIPPGSTSVGALKEPAVARAALMLDPSLTVVVFVGRLVRYKGLDLLLAALATPISGLAIRIAGACSDEAYAGELTAAARHARASGVDVLLDIRRITDNEYALRLAAADFAIFPFRSITNSETVMTAMSSGVPVLLPALDALSDFPEGAALKWNPSDGCAGIRAVLEQATRTDERQRLAMRSAALLWVDTRKWSDVAEATRVVYQETLRTNIR